MNEFGGDWTEKKLSVLEYYLRSYTTALKKTSFRLVYIDAFAGSGRIQIHREEDPDNALRNFLDGSVMRAIQTSDRPFNELIFIDKDEENCRRLEQIRDRHKDRTIIVHNGEANEFLLELERDWKSCRGVLFLDPYGTQVKFETLQRVAQFEALDTWILVPVSTISRFLPRAKEPGAISPEWKRRLNQIYGDDSWHDLYRDSPQQELFKERPDRVRTPGVQGLISIYKAKLRTVFGSRFLEDSLELKNSKNSVMYEMMFCCGSLDDKAIGISHNIAKYLINEKSADV